MRTYEMNFIVKLMSINHNDLKGQNGEVISVDILVPQDQ
jgi:hypothetical protein